MESLSHVVRAVGGHGRNVSVGAATNSVHQPLYSHGGGVGGVHGRLPQGRGVTRDRTEDFKRWRTGILRTVDLGTPLVGGKPELVIQKGKMVEMHSLTRNSDADGDEPDVNAPAWMSLVDETKYTFNRIQTKITELQRLHRQHLLPDFDDRVEEEHEIEILTADITSMFHQCQKRITRLGKLPGGGSQEVSLRSHIQADLAASLQRLSGDFRGAQKVYLTKLQQRLDRTNQFAGVQSAKGGAGGRPKRSRNTYDIEEGSSGGDDSMMSGGESDSSGNYNASFDIGFSERQLLELEDAESDSAARASEIKAIHKSIIELAEIFKEMAVLVVDQGTILDRIDYNIEAAARDVDRVVVELGHAEVYQKKTGQKLCMLLLLGLIFGVVIILVVKILLGF
eukprot:TRINITY_DN7992_c0_g1_i1.p1 TRINITY_DN7992_c0_g1~~TRINITY_DN7992_c0_g1_i1.p1  ORF type:complete len:395 (-),score=62.34 TRINITY_DN7992_c0_g1_i1:23-1207(-)